MTHDPLSASGQPAERGDFIVAEAIDAAPQPRPRRFLLPVALFVATCCSTFWVAVAGWVPMWPIGESAMVSSAMPIRRVVIANWDQGLIYMACVLAILVTHEMGHFLTTIRYRVPASYPYFIPFPIAPIGTMGAVIAMDRKGADRKQLFDIGLAGPIAGLIVAIPITWIGIQQLDLTQPAVGPYALDMPLAIKLAMEWAQPKGYQTGDMIAVNQLNPFFMAGWVGLLITGLNMLPVSQLDGGHVCYTMFGRKAHWVARGFMVIAVAYTVIAQQYTWILMIALVFLVGAAHPPTRDDRVPLGWYRYAWGCAALFIPVFCFAPRLIVLR